MSSQALSSQVGGHPGILSNEDGSLVIKPCLPAELAFYQATADASSPLHALRPLIPDFLGTLRLAGQLPPGQKLDAQAALQAAAASQEKEHIVLQNLTHPFLHPCVLDVKLGTQLHDATASDEKRARMEKTARETTSWETGVRLTGFQTWDESTKSSVTVPKSYGKSITSSQLADGLRLFFPSSPSGLPSSLLLPVLTQVIDDVERIRQAVSSLPARFVGMSVLVVYEGDSGALRAALDRSTEEEEEEEGESEDNDDEEGESDLNGPATLVKLIDFAHSGLVSEGGPDEGVLKGLDTLLSLLKGRLSEL